MCFTQKIPVGRRNFSKNTTKCSERKILAMLERCCDIAFEALPSVWQVYLHIEMIFVQYSGNRMHGEERKTIYVFLFKYSIVNVMLNRDKAI